jgi:hypothetical protein
LGAGAHQAEAGIGDWAFIVSLEFHKQEFGLPSQKFLCFAENSALVKVLKLLIVLNINENKVTRANNYLWEWSMQMMNRCNLCKGSNYVEFSIQET